jgi:hypothetical protein
MHTFVTLMALVAILVGLLFPEEGGVLLLILGGVLLTWSLHRLSGRLFRAQPLLVRRNDSLRRVAGRR